MKGFTGARFKKFDNEDAAAMFVRGETVATIEAKHGDLKNKDKTTADAGKGSVFIMRDLQKLFFYVETRRCFF